MLSVNAKVRSELGKQNKKLREQGMLPGVLYGPRVKETIPLSLKYEDFDNLYKEAGESSLISLNVGETENVVLIRDVVAHPLTRKFIHSDFYQVPMDEEITITIPIVIDGEPPAVKNEGAIFIRNLYEIDVTALPKDLPKEIVVDVSGLEHIDDSILVKDLVVSEGVVFDAEEDMVIASVSAPEEEEIMEEAPEEVSVDDIKTEAEEKREEEAEEEALEGEPGEQG